MSKYYVVSCHVLWRELCYYAALSENIYNFNFLKQGLHNTPELLKRDLQAAIDAVPVPEGWEAVLIGYGLCSNGLVGIRARNHPLVVMRGHDCITFLLGSKEKYQEYFNAHPGTYWYSPGWIETGYVPSRENFLKRQQEYEAKYGPENTEFLMEQENVGLQNYSNAAYVDLGISDAKKYHDYTAEAAEWLHWNCDIMRGNPQLVKDFLDGKWDDSRFLVVQPGQQIVASYDEKVITVEDCPDE